MERRDEPSAPFNLKEEAHDRRTGPAVFTAFRGLPAIEKPQHKAAAAPKAQRCGHPAGCLRHLAQSACL